MQHLFTIKQQNNEALRDYYARFMSMVEVVEDAFGTLVPEAVAKECDEYSSKTREVRAQERRKLLAVLLMMGAKRDVYWRVSKDLHRQFALGMNNYPVCPEDTLEVLDSYGDSEAKGKDKSFLQQGRIKCWGCGKEGVKRSECPVCQKKQKKDQDDWSSVESVEEISSYQLGRSSRSWDDS